MNRVKEIKQIPSKIVHIFEGGFDPRNHMLFPLKFCPSSPSVLQFPSQYSKSVLLPSHLPFSLLLSVLWPKIWWNPYHFLKLLCFLWKLWIFYFVAENSLDKGLFVEGLRIVGCVVSEKGRRGMDMGDVWGLNHFIKLITKIENNEFYFTSALYF